MDVSMRRGRKHAAVLPAPSMHREGPVWTSRHVEGLACKAPEQLRDVERRRGAEAVGGCRSRLVEDAGGEVVLDKDECVGGKSSGGGGRAGYVRRRGGGSPSRRGRTRRLTKTLHGHGVPSHVRWRSDSLGRRCVGTAKMTARRTLHPEEAA
jgi:hypothetical protein